MSEHLQRVILVRHGQTPWSLSGQHTGRTDIQLTARGEENARAIGRRLTGAFFECVFASPSQRARRTCELAGFDEQAEIVNDLAEWDYGQLEGLLTSDIRRAFPGWEIFRDGAPGGESVADVRERADRVVAMIRAVQGDVLIFSSGHFLRALASRWIGQELIVARSLLLDTGTISILGHEHRTPAIALWNEMPPGVSATA